LTVSQLGTSAHAITKNGAGALAVNNVRAESLSINAGTVAILSNGSAGGASRVGSLVMNESATLDLSDNDMVARNGSYAQVTERISHARNLGAWDQSGLTSSAARVQATHATTLAVVNGADYIAISGNTFGPFTIDGTDLLVKYTWYGDTDLNGVVDFDDYSRTDSGFNTGGSDWLHGDFDYNGHVDFDDYSLIDLAFNTQTGTLRRAMSYLEGGDRSDAGMNEPALRIVMEHFSQFGSSYASSFLNAVPEPTGTLPLGIGALVAMRRLRSRRKSPRLQR
jgi:hypothetical protein